MGATYKEVYETLKKRIARKEYAIGDLLPPEPELEKEFGVSRTTIRRAIELLVQDGCIVKKQGFGTQVVSRKAIQNLNKFTSIGDSLEKKGHVIGVKSCYIEKTLADEELSNTLAVPIGAPIICIHRIRTADGIPIGIVHNYIVASYVPGLEEETCIERLYAFLREKYAIKYTGSRDIIGACNANFEESQLLNIQPKTALLTVRRICSVNNQPIELDIVRIVASNYEFEVYFKTLDE